MPRKLDTTARQVLEIEQRWVAAHRRLDLAAIEGILASDYRQIRADGTLLGGEAVLESCRSGERYWEIAASSDFDLRFEGGIALLLGRWHGKGVNAGQPFDYTVRFLSVYVRKGASWKLWLDCSLPGDARA